MPSWTMVLDESLHTELLTVGGFMVRTKRLLEVAETWRSLKSDVFGIDSQLELKYTCPSGHPGRVALEANHWDQASRVPKMLETIKALDLTLLADTLVDLRWDESEKDPRQFYIHALKWCVRRLANQVQDLEKGVHWVVVDTFSNLGTTPFGTYAEQFWKPERFGAGIAPSLSECGLVPMLTASHAKHSDLLQIADVIAGCVREFCAYNLTRAEFDILPDVSYQDRNMALIASSFRRGAGRIRGYGFDVFPRNHSARDDLVDWAERLATEGLKAVGG